MRIIVYVLLACQAAVIYYWISDWRQLVTPVGLFIWGGAIAVSLAVLRMGRSISPRWRGMLKMTTAGVSLLAVVSLLIEWATRSMP
ncbi:hypothetical protein GTID1_01735 [Geobacillus thermodenitrificans]|jgi:hypothetical protein|uniref:Uncharacterized protein n=1 Tax=Geobacillus thermodenitrificans TaxID=33940 RepID=A0ABY9QHV3_GEOTD|nr:MULTISPECIES: hypothetical protein [Geobacillus]ARP42651.1 hypothetical protein GTHT12_01098 [Geobacillus thermodenitrificans]ATO36042.1 hypothetical protein GTID1_01735 [Geobacillus thermodenitrificans]KQB93450.1 putative membrane protein [Geobacillus sp. PA-3]NNU86442.1 hypothetical protein [Geobacillus sp. MR]WMV77841.1 hypothetical protein HSX42_08940 [Geobacillus thermodenitrificans]